MTYSTSKVMPMRDAISRFVHDGDTVVIEGFTHLICFAAGHEIIRQGRRDLTLARLRPQAGVFVGGEPWRRLAACVPTRGGREERGGARDRGILALRHGRPVFRRGGAAALLAATKLYGHRSADRQPAHPIGHVSVYG